MSTIRRAVAGLVGASMMLTTMCNPILATAAGTPQPQESGVEYEIYPTPHQVTYGETNGLLQLSHGVNLVLEDTLDQYTVQKAQTVLEEHGIPFQVGQAIDDSQVNLLVGTADTSGADDAFLQGRYDPDASVNQTDGYVLLSDAQEKTLAISGGTAKAAFYGLETLDQMLDQSASQVRDVTIEDYANVGYRGIIEGFYGEYSHQERLDLMEFCGQFKMNNYIYGAKSDPYHMGDKWADLYPEDKLNELKELVDKGYETGMNLVWTVHLAGKVNFSSDEDVEKVFHKFTQLYDIGVRQFGVFFDDGYTGGSNEELTSFINKLDDKIKTLDGTLPLIYCPENYCGTRWGGKLDAIKDFNDDVMPMWTGDDVISEIDQGVIDRITGTTQRDAYIWWNYPVNDLGMWDYMHVGPSRYLQKGLTGISGLVSNPMTQSEPSKIALFSIADFDWNTEDYDYQTSWESSFRYVSPDEDFAQALYTFAKNCSDAAYQLDMGESSHMIPDMLAVENKLATDQDCQAECQRLVAQLTDIVEATELLKSYEDNNLVRQMSGWIDQLQKVAQTAKSIAARANDYRTVNGDNVDAAKDFIAANQESLNDAKSGLRAGRREIVPFAQAVLDILSQKVAVAQGETPAPRGYGDCHGDYPAILDDNTSSQTNINRRCEVGQFFGVDYGQAIQLNNISLYMTNGQHYAKGVLEYSLDGVEWTQIGEYTSAEVTATDLGGVMARFVRYRCEEVLTEQNTGKPVVARCNELTVNGPILVSRGKPVTANPSGCEVGAPANLTDGTGANWQAISQDEAEAIIDLEKEYWVDTIKIDFERASPKYDILVAGEDQEYHKVAEIIDGPDGKEGQGVVTFEFEPQYVRYVKYAQHKMYNSGYSSKLRELEVYQTTQEPTPVGDTIRVGTFNIQGGANGDESSLNAMGQLVAQHHIQLLGMQEVYGEDMAKTFAQQANYPVYYFGPALGDWYGNGIASSLELDGAQTVDLPGGGEHRVYMRTEFEVDGKRVAYYNTHLAWESAAYRAEQIETLKQAMLAETCEYVILTGDFNAQESREEWLPFLDAFNMANGGDGVWDRTMDQADHTDKKFFDIDNIITTRNIQVSNITVVNEDTSDHDLFYADLKLLDETPVTTQYKNAAKDAAQVRVDSGEYSQASTAEVQTLIDQAEAMTAENSTQEELDNMAQRLIQAMQEMQPSNLALHKSVEVDNEACEVGAPENLTDGGSALWQPAKRDEAWAIVDLGQEYPVGRIELELERSTPNYEVLVAGEDKVFTSVYSVTDGPNGKDGKGVVEITVEPTQRVRYVKYLQREMYTSSSSKYGSKVVEIRVYEGEQAPENVNKTLLQKTYDYAVTLSTDGVTDAAKAAFEEALTNAKAVLADDKATQEEVNAAWDALLEGIWSLGLTQGDKTMLEQLIAKAEAMDETKYVADDWPQLVDALAKAKDVAADGDAMEEDIQPVAQALLDAILAQRFKADKSILEDLVNKAEGMDLSGYTAESVAVFRSALATAQAVLADNSLSEDDQATVDNAVAALSAAMDGLTAGGAPETTDQPEASQKPEATQKPENHVPQTGDSSSLLLWSVVGMLALAGVTGVVCTKKKQED